ncbi:hypothetical protein NLJ89_g10290 [Agrocybe chaxingu]|uniref:Uncharacterized protein n=1 Tax=Agrocybe chaxingu TaxID=84603 RepID=A0A9W8JRE9_9AGAR|nr:hypothetical protein NLJ89_g10290 [Agrocybe chaxingu]
MLLKFGISGLGNAAFEEYVTPPKQDDNCTTRSGRAYSTFLEPLFAPPTFSTADSIRRQEEELVGYESNEEFEDLPENEPMICQSSHQAEPARSLLDPLQRLPGLTKSQWNNMKNRHKRQNERATGGISGSVKKCGLKYRKPAAEAAIVSTIAMQSDFTPTIPAWINRKEKKQDWSEYGVDELVDKFEMIDIDWNGR